MTRQVSLILTRPDESVTYVDPQMTFETSVLHLSFQNGAILTLPIRRLVSMTTVTVDESQVGGAEDA